MDDSGQHRPDTVTTVIINMDVVDDSGQHRPVTVATVIINMDLLWMTVGNTDRIL